MKIHLSDTNTIIGTYDDSALNVPGYWVYTESSVTVTFPETGPNSNVLVLSAAQIAYHVRKYRDELLSASDWTQMPDVKLPAAKKFKWVEYRQALRDITNQLQDAGVNGRNIMWPAQPKE